MLKVYIGPNLTTVHYLRSQSEVAWFYSQLPWKTKHYKIDPFKVNNKMYNNLLKMNVYTDNTGYR